jgi:hypothetical protein
VYEDKSGHPISFVLAPKQHPVTPALKKSNILGKCGDRQPAFSRGERIKMFDSLEDQMKAEDMEGSAKERLMRYIVIGAVSVVAVAAVFGAVQFLK